MNIIFIQFSLILATLFHRQENKGLKGYIICNMFTELSPQTRIPLQYKQHTVSLTTLGSLSDDFTKSRGFAIQWKVEMKC